MHSRKCFISAQYGQDLHALQRACEELDVDWQWANIAPGDYWGPNSISDVIKKCSFLIAVVSETDLNPNVMLEIGIAIGNQLPILLLTEAKVSLPMQLGTLTHFSTDLRDQHLLSFQIDLFLRSLPGTRARRARSPRALPAEPSSKSASWESLNSHLERDVARAIVAAGGGVSVPGRSGHNRLPDLLMWLPQMDRELFNPAAIEVKAHVQFEGYRKMQSWLSEFVVNANAGCGLIVVAEINLPDFVERLSPVPRLFPITLDEFKSRLGLGELASWIRRERNRLAHGAR